jgi:hypothetical protein
MALKWKERSTLDNLIFFLGKIIIVLEFINFIEGTMSEETIIETFRDKRGEK